MSLALTFGFLASKAASVILLLPVWSCWPRSLWRRWVLEPFGPWYLLVYVVGQVSHDTNAVLHRLGERGVKCELGLWGVLCNIQKDVVFFTLLSISFFPTADCRAWSRASTKPSHSLSLRRASAPSELTFLYKMTKYELCKKKRNAYMDLLASTDIEKTKLPAVVHCGVLQDLILGFLEIIASFLVENCYHWSTASSSISTTNGRYSFAHRLKLTGSDCR